MSSRTRHLLALLCAFAALVALGCGSDDQPKGKKLPRAAVAELQSYLNEVERRYNDAHDNDNPGACRDIQTRSFRDIDRILSDLPDDVDADLRGALDDSFSRLRQLTSEGCAGVEAPKTDTTPTDTGEETVPPETLPPDTTETTPPPTDTTPTDTGNQNGTTTNNGGASPNQGGGGLQAPGE